MYLFWISRLYKIQQQQLIDPKKQYGFHYVWILTALKLRHLKNLVAKYFTRVSLPGVYDLLNWRSIEVKVRLNLKFITGYWLNPHILQNLINLKSTVGMDTDQHQLD